MIHLKFNIHTHLWPNDQMNFYGIDIAIATGEGIEASPSRAVARNRPSAAGWNTR